MRGNRLEQAVYGSAKWMQPFPLLCLTLVRAIAVVALTRPPCHRLRRSPKSSRSTAHANVACARWLQGRRGALEAARQSLGASQLRMLGNWCRDTHGDHAIALREVILAIHAFADRRLLCSKHWCSQPRFGAVLDGGCAAARQIRWRAVHNPTRAPTTAKSGRNVCLGQRRPRPGEGTVRSRHCRGDAERCGRIDR